VRIEAVETVREPDGLAVSSRNRYLSEPERRIAPALYRTLLSLSENLAAAKEAGPGEIAAMADGAARDLVAAGFTKLDYLEVRDAATLEPVTGLARPARVLAAAWLGKTRLIDNVPVPVSR